MVIFLFVACIFFLLSDQKSVIMLQLVAYPLCLFPEIQQNCVKPMSASLAAQTVYVSSEVPLCVPIPAC